jgi:transposase
VPGRRRGDYPTRVFETYVEKVLVPHLEPKQIVIMDNLGAHRPKRIREMIEQRGCELLYLPAYSPDYNPIEEALAKIKNLASQGCSQEQRSLGRSGRCGAICDHRRRCPGLLRARRLPSSRSATVKRAVMSLYIILSLWILSQPVVEDDRSATAGEEALQALAAR